MNNITVSLKDKMAEVREKTGRNVILKFSGELISRLSMALFFLVFTNILGPEDYGAYTSLNSLFPLFAIIGDLGINMVIIRNMILEPQSYANYYKKIVKLKFILTFFYLIFSLGLSLIISFDPSELTILYYMIIFLATYNLYETYLYLLTGQDNLKDEFIVKLFNRVSSASLGIIVIVVTKSLVNVLIVHIVINFLSIVFAALFVKKHTVFLDSLRTINGDISYKSILRLAIPFIVINIFLNIYYKIDVVMLKMMRGDIAEIGNYGAALKIHEIAGTIPIILVAAVFPILGKLWLTEKQKMIELSSKLLKFIIIYSLLFAIIFSIFSENIILQIMNEDFLLASKLLVVLMCSLIFSSINVVLLNISVIIGQQDKNMVATILAVCLNIILNYLFIPEYGALGACIATLSSELLLFVFIIIRNKKLWPIEIKSLTIVRVLGSFLIGLIVLFIPYKLHYIIQLLLLTGTIMVLLFIFKGITKGEIYTIKEMLIKKK